MISVCIATHNGAHYIKEQIESVLCQLGPKDEIIISDDGSTDNTIDILLAFNDKRIIIHHYQQPVKSKHSHTYVCKNFENALKHAKGDYIFLADQDDWWMPNKVEKCIEALKYNILVVHRAEICDRDLNLKGQMLYKDNFVFNNFLSLKRGKYYGCTLAFRNELLDFILPFPKKLILHDQWIGCMAELKGRVFYERTPLIKYRLHGGNTSGGPSSNSIFFQIWYRLYMFVHLIIRSKIDNAQYYDFKLWYKARNN